MNRNKKIFSFAILAASVATTLGVISTLNTNSFATAKAECAHHEVNHHEGNSNRTFAGSEGEYVDHWICCGCHTVWADEARTIVLGNSQTDRTKIDLRNIQSYKFQWDYNGTPYYSEELGVYYKKTLLGTKDFNVNGSFYVETPNAPELDTKVVGVSFTLYNDTKFNLNVQPMNIDANINFGETINVLSGTSHTFTLTTEQFNTKSSNFGVNQREHGFQLWITGTKNDTITADDTIRITTPKFAKKTDPSPLVGQGMTASALDWGQVPTENGTYLLKNSYGYHYLDPRVAIPEWATLYLSFNNPTSTDAIVDFGSDYAVTGTISVPAHGTRVYLIPSNVWNAPVDSKVDTDKIRFTVSGASDLELDLYYAYDDTLDNFVSELDSIELNDTVENNLYVKDFYTKLKPVLDRIHSHYGADVPSEITSHKNYLDYADATTFEIWEYGAPIVGQENIDGITFAKVTATASEKGEQSVITKAFPSNTKADKFVFSIYNKTESSKTLNVHNGYGQGGWNVAGNIELKAKQWNTIVLDKAIFDDFDQGFALIFIGCEVGNEFLVSPVVDYCYDIEGEVVYNGNITVRGDNKDWASAAKTLTRYGETYSSGHTNSAIEDPEWKATLLYLNNPGTIDASKYSHVKFYVYNNHDMDLFIALKGAGEQYNFEDNGNVVSKGEWKEFTIPTSKWNANGGHLELIFSANEHHSGTILVSRFVGVNA